MKMSESDSQRNHNDFFLTKRAFVIRRCPSRGEPQEARTSLSLDDIFPDPAHLLVGKYGDRRYPDGNAAYRFLEAALKLLGECGKLDESAEKRLHDWVLAYNVLQRYMWRDIFPEKPEMHDYVGVVREVGRLLKRVRNGTIPDEMLGDLNEVIKHMKSQLRKTNFDLSRMETLFAWLGVGINVKVSMGRKKMAQLVPELPWSKSAAILS